jgi:RNA polymerase sigma-70 factor (ECF subfamily)
MDAIEIPQAVAAMRPQMLRFSRLQLRSNAAAEDVVQEAMLSALQGAAGFSGAAALKTWVFSILRNKIVDDVRRQTRVPELRHIPGDEGSEIEDLFFEEGHWVENPSTWASPEAALEQRQFWTIFEACLNDIPAKPGRVFMMREFLGPSTDEICKEFSISPSNCWVLLHRARLGLRECLALRWFHHSHDEDGMSGIDSGPR